MNDSIPETPEEQLSTEHPPRENESAAQQSEAQQLAAPPTEAEAREAREYAQVGLRCTIADMVLDLFVLAVLAVAVGPWIDSWLKGFMQVGEDQSYARLAVFAAVVTLLHSFISLPLSYYAGHVVEHRFGLSTQTTGGWLTSWLKKTVLTLLLLVAMYTGLFAIIWSTGGWWWLAAAAAFFLMSAVLGQLVPVLVLPLFYKVEPLAGDDHTERMQGMASDAGMKIEGVYRLGMSAETTKANAMLAGLGATRRVLLGDTLLKEFSPAEIDVVFAHELGHFVRRHLPKMLALAGVTALGGFYACHLALVAWTGVEDPTLWPVASLPAVVLALTVFSMLMGPVQNLMSRQFEREADRYAIEATGDVQAFHSAFLKLARMNKAELTPGPVEVFLLHSHPPISERLALVGAPPASSAGG